MHFWMARCMWCWCCWIAHWISMYRFFPRCIMEPLFALLLQPSTRYIVFVFYWSMLLFVVRCSFVPTCAWFLHQNIAVAFPSRKKSPNWFTACNARARGLFESYYKDAGLKVKKTKLEGARANCKGSLAIFTLARGTLPANVPLTS